MIFTDNVVYLDHLCQIYGRTQLDSYLTKKLGIFSLLYVHIVDYLPHLKSFYKLIWTYRKRPVIIYKNMIKIFAFTQQSDANFLNFWLSIFKIPYFKNWKSFWPYVKSESLALVSAITWHNMTHLYMLKTHNNFHKKQTKKWWSRKPKV